MAKRPVLRRLFCLGLLLCALGACGAPSKGVYLPERPAGTHVLDVAGVLSADTKARLDAHNDALAAAGAAVTVVTVDVLGGRDVAEYAQKLMEEWDLDSGSQNGVLILLATGEASYRIVQGTALRKDLSDDLLADYAWNYLERDFAAGHYDAGVRKLADALVGWYKSYYPRELGADQSPEEAAAVLTEPSKRSGSIPVWAILLLCAGAAILVAVALKKRGGSASSRRSASHSRGASRRRYHGSRRRR